MNRINTLQHTLTTVEKSLNNKNYSQMFDDLSYDDEVCIQIVTGSKLAYYSNFFKHCADKDNERLAQIKDQFIQSNKNLLRLEFVNNSYNNKLLLYGKKVDKDKYVFVNTSLEPMDKSIMLLKSQFRYVAIAVFVLSFIISYYFSKRIASPILKINSEAKKLGSKSSEADFTSNTDVYELQELSNTLKDAALELNRIEEVRKEFLANVSHDLKTPLTMIEAYAASAKDLNYNNKKKRERDLNIIIDEAERLNTLVNDILLLSKIENKTNKLNIEEFDITDFIKTILERFAIYTNDGYRFEFNEKKPYIVCADKKGIERVIYNLINNAINYTGNDKIVKLELVDEKNYLLVKVIDTGKGIEEKNKKLVWNKYFRINKRHRREVVGTGLGLSIVRQILEEHNFEYGIDSTLNKGTCFWFKCKKKK